MRDDLGNPPVLGGATRLASIVLGSGQAFAPFSASAIDNFTPIFSFHAFAKTAVRLPFLFTGLIGALHGGFSSNKVPMREYRGLD